MITIREKDYPNALIDMFDDIESFKQSTAKLIKSYNKKARKNNLILENKPMIIIELQGRQVLTYADCLEYYNKVLNYSVINRNEYNFVDSYRNL